VSKTIYVSQGAKRYVGGTITEVNGADISTDAIVGALGDYETPPLKSSASAPSSVAAGATNAQRIVKQLIDNTVTPAEDRWYWVWITDNPEIEPIRLDGPINIR
jgi:hypothetical protein